MSQKFLHRHRQDVPDEFIYFRPIHAEAREEAKRQKQQKSTIVSHQHTREGIYQRDLGIISQMIMVTTPTPTNQRVREHCPYKTKTFRASSPRENFS